MRLGQFVHGSDSFTADVRLNPLFLHQIEGKGQNSVGSSILRSEDPERVLLGSLWEPTGPHFNSDAYNWTFYLRAGQGTVTVGFASKNTQKYSVPQRPNILNILFFFLLFYTHLLFSRTAFA